MCVCVYLYILKTHMTVQNSLARQPLGAFAQQSRHQCAGNCGASNLLNSCHEFVSIPNACHCKGKLTGWSGLPGMGYLMKVLDIPQMSIPERGVRQCKKLTTNP